MAMHNVRITAAYKILLKLLMSWHSGPLNTFQFVHTIIRIISSRRTVSPLKSPSFPEDIKVNRIQNYKEEIIL